MGTRSDVGSMFAIGSVKEDFLGFDSLDCLHLPLLISSGHSDLRLDRRDVIVAPNIMAVKLDFSHINKEGYPWDPGRMRKKVLLRRSE